MDVQSFTIDHEKLLRGIYVSRKDRIGNETVTTFDIRMKEPNREPVMDTSVMHTLEHLMAVFLRGHKTAANELVYIGPMGCRTGMYAIFKGDLDVADIVPWMQETFQYIIAYKGDVPATKPIHCGNCLDHNLGITQWEAHKYHNEILKDLKKENMVYPD